MMKRGKADMSVNAREVKVTVPAVILKIEEALAMVDTFLYTLEDAPVMFMVVLIVVLAVSGVCVASLRCSVVVRDERCVYP